MAPLAWPSVLKASAEAWNFNAGASRAGPPSLTNVEQAITAPTGRVRASLTVPCNTPARVLAMRALLAGLDGRAGTVLVGPCEAGRRPSGPRSFRLAAAAALNATTLSIRRTSGGLLQAGQVVGIGGNRLHLITRLNGTDDGGVGPVSVTVRPWLRAAYAANTVLQMGAPLCEMQLATDDVPALELSLSRRGVVTLDLVEAPPEAA
ncbi:MAG: hypothetical protein WAP03_18610 [Methylorubrum rhodinum]|uniref:hypothetical protein n=1 Tax=Methylorubrum rhodinum TaxID=29428 RepID=UPI003BAF32CD